MSSRRTDPPACAVPPAVALPHRFAANCLARHCTILILAFAAVLALSAVASADLPPAPSAAALQAQLSLNVLPYWKITGLTVEASANYGNAVEPVYKQRVVAIVAPIDDLYLPAGKVDNVNFLTLSMKAGEARKLYLIASSTLRADTWQTTFERQNDPTAGAGKPRGFYPGATIVRGSPEEQDYQKLQAAEAAARQQQQLAAIAQQQALAAATANGQAATTQQAASLQAAKAKAAEEEATRRHAAFEASLQAIEANANNLLKADLPAWWQIKTFTLSTPADVTEAAALTPEAVVRQHFAATAVLTADTFIAAKGGAVALLQPALKAGAERNLDGVVESVLGPEGWRSKLTLGNSIGAADGKPRSYYTGTTMVQGSPEEQAYQKQQAAEAAARQQQQLAAIAQQQALAAATAKGPVEKVQQAASLQAAMATAAAEEATGRHAAFEASLKAIEANANNLLRADLPAWRQIKSLTLTPPADVTEQAVLTPQAVVRQLLMATVALGEDTFAPGKAGEGETTILHPALKTGAVLNLEGTLQSVLAPEGWRSTLAISGKLPTAADGQPRSYYPGTVIIAGSPEEAAYRQRQAAIFQKGALSPGTYKFQGITCKAQRGPLSDGRVSSFLSCVQGGWNGSMAFISGPANGDHPLRSGIMKLGLDGDTADFAWGQITDGNFQMCNNVIYHEGALVGAQQGGQVLTLFFFPHNQPKCEWAGVRTGS